MGAAVARIGSPEPAGGERTPPPHDQPRADEVPARGGGSSATGQALDPDRLRTPSRTPSRTPAQAPAPARGAVAPVVPGSVPGVDAAPDDRLVSPVVARLATDHRLDLAAVVGTGHGHRITRSDAEAAIAARAATPRRARDHRDHHGGTGAFHGGAGRRGGSRRGRPGGRSSPGGPPQPDPGPHRRAHGPLRRHRSARADRRRGRLSRPSTGSGAPTGRRWRSDEGFGLTYLPFILVALGTALRDHPLVNGSFVGDGVALNPECNVAVAVDLDLDGLVAPVVRRVDDKRFRALAREVVDLAARARGSGAATRRPRRRHLHRHQRRPLPHDDAVPDHQPAAGGDPLDRRRRPQAGRDRRRRRPGGKSPSTRSACWPWPGTTGPSTAPTPPPSSTGCAICCRAPTGRPSSAERPGRYRPPMRSLKAWVAPTLVGPLGVAALPGPLDQHLDVVGLQPGHGLGDELVQRHGAGDRWR